MKKVLKISIKRTLKVKNKKKIQFKKKTMKKRRFE
jgi:hypothetical protein